MGDDRTDAELIALAREGDEAALADVFRRYSARLEQRVRARLSPAIRRKVSAADVLQEAYVVAHQRLEEFEERGEGSFGQWLAGIVERKALHAVRRFAGTQKRAVTGEVSRDARRETAAFAGGMPSPSQLAMGAELREAARRALEQLPEDYRMAVQLRQMEHLTLAEAAERMGRSTESVKKLYARGLARLAELLDVRPGESHD